MYELPEVKYLKAKEIQAFLGIGRGTLLRLCQNKTQNIPVVKVGREYRADAEKLAAWRDAWYSGKFSIDD